MAVVSLAAMAFMSHGSTPGRGPFGRQVNLCLEFLLANARPSGLLATERTPSQATMYGHGFGTLFLAEVYGTSERPAVRERLSRAVQLIVEAQSAEGGWRYEPRPLDADISVTACQVMALRAARNAGLFVPQATIQRSIDYVRRCQNSDGGFMYMPGGGPSAFARSAAGLAALFSGGVYEGQEIQRALDYLMRHADAGGIGNEPYFFYGHYYAAHCAWLAGDAYWNRWFSRVRGLLLDRQGGEGDWSDPTGREYATAMACLILLMPESYLPIFHR